jgi:hypothetical protein
VTGRLHLALGASLVAIAAPGCLGSASQPSGKVSVVVTPGEAATSAVTHRYTLTCGPAAGTMPAPGAACDALADYLQHRDDSGRFCSGPVPKAPNAVVAGRFDGHHLRIEITPGSWCGVSDALMRDYWVLSTFPCSTLVFRYANQHPYSKGIAPERCLRGSGSS